MGAFGATKKIAKLVIAIVSSSNDRWSDAERRRSRSWGVLGTRRRNQWFGLRKDRSTIFLDGSKGVLEARSLRLSGVVLRDDSDDNCDEGCPRENCEDDGSQRH
jgi:hypothetical protein